MPDTIDEVLSQMERAADNGFLDTDALAQYQVEATIVLADQVRRIADLLEGELIRMKAANVPNPDGSI